MSEYRDPPVKKKNPLLADDVFEIARLYGIPYEFIDDPEHPHAVGGLVQFHYRNDTDRRLIESALRRAIKRQEQRKRRLEKQEAP